MVNMFKVGDKVILLEEHEMNQATCDCFFEEYWFTQFKKLFSGKVLTVVTVGSKNDYLRSKDNVAVQIIHKGVRRWIWTDALKKIG